LAAQTLLDNGHEVVVNARNRDRLSAVGDLVDRGATAIVGDSPTSSRRAASPAT
jgi:NADP-dependent 3-hydroxy acid dehydrogenase YdfG